MCLGSSLLFFVLKNNFASWWLHLCFLLFPFVALCGHPLLHDVYYSHVGVDADVSPVILVASLMSIIISLALLSVPSVVSALLFISISWVVYVLSALLVPSVIGIVNLIGLLSCATVAQVCIPHVSVSVPSITSVPVTSVSCVHRMFPVIRMSGVGVQVPVSLAVVRVG